jgi:hypothetical protein
MELLLVDGVKGFSSWAALNSLTRIGGIMAKKTVWILREPDGWLSAFGTMKDLKECLADWASTNETKGMQLGQYSLDQMIPIKELLPKEKK